MVSAATNGVSVQVTEIDADSICSVEESDRARSYFEYVSTLATQWTFLQRLVLFMSPSSQVMLKIPARGENPARVISQAKLIGEDARLSKIDIVVLDLIGDDSTNISTCTAQVKEHFSSIGPPGSSNSTQKPGTVISSASENLKDFLSLQVPQNVRARLLLVEDLSKDAIEILGSVFKLDPEFFAHHIRRTRTVYVDAAGAEIKLRHFLEDVVQVRDHPNREHFHLEFRRSYKPSTSPEESSILYPDAVVVRSVESLDDIVNVKEKVSMWYQYDEDANLLTGIVLFDVPMKAACFPTEYGLPGTISCPTYPSLELPLTTVLPGSRGSLRRDFIASLVTQKETNDSPIAGTPGTWFAFKLSQLVIERLSWFADRIEKEVMALEEKINRLNREEDVTAPALNRRGELHKLFFLHNQALALSRELPRNSARVIHRLMPAEVYQHRFAEDIDCLVARADSWEQRIEATQSALRTFSLVQQGHYSYEHEKALGKITQLGFVFLPLSLVASVMSVGQLTDVATEMYWMYFAVAVPLSVLTILIGEWVSKRKVFGRHGMLATYFKNKRTKRGDPEVVI